MSRRSNTLDQSLDVGGSCTQNDTLTSANEPLKLGPAVSGQLGSSANISVVVGDIVTITGLIGMTASSVGRCLTISGASSAGNNGTFNITTFSSASTVNINNSTGIAADVNNGSISWIEREPYTLEDDINYSRTDRKLIKGTTNWHDPLPTYVRPTDTLTDVPTNLANIAGNTLDAVAWIDNLFQESVAVSTGDGYITIIDTGNLKHADSVDITGVPVIDGYDSGNFKKAFVAITGADGTPLQVLNGPNTGAAIVGMTKEGFSTSPNSVEIEFYSIALGDLDFSTLALYTWESAHPAFINVCYGFRELLNRIDENSLRTSLIKDTLKVGGSGGSLSPPDEECQVLYAVSSSAFTSELPLTSPNGWLVNGDGCLLVIG